MSELTGRPVRAPGSSASQSSPSCCATSPATCSREGVRGSLGRCVGAAFSSNSSKGRSKSSFGSARRSEIPGKQTPPDAFEAEAAEAPEARSVTYPLRRSKNDQPSRTHPRLESVSMFPRQAPSPELVENSEPAQEHAEHLRLIRIIDATCLLYPGFGSRQVTDWLRRQKEPVNRKQVRRINKSAARETERRWPQVARITS